MKQYQLFINNEFVDAADKRTFPGVNPANQELIATFACAGVVDVQKAVAAAREAFDGGPWPRMTRNERADVLKAIADKRSKYRLLEIDLKNAYLDLKQKELLVWRSEKEKKSARQIVFLTKSNLDIGLGEKKDYLEALQSYLLIQAAVYENVYNYNIAVATVKQKIGKLYDPRGLATQGVYDLPKDFYE